MSDLSVPVPVPSGKDEAVVPHHPNVTDTSEGNSTMATASSAKGAKDVFHAAVTKVQMINALAREVALRVGNPCFYDRATAPAVVEAKAALPCTERWAAGVITSLEEGHEEEGPTAAKTNTPTTQPTSMPGKDVQPALLRKATLRLDGTGEIVAVQDADHQLHCNKTSGWHAPAARGPSVPFDDVDMCTVADTHDATLLVSLKNFVEEVDFSSITMPTTKSNATSSPASSAGATALHRQLETSSSLPLPGGGLLPVGGKEAVLIHSDCPPQALDVRGTALDRGNVLLLGDNPVGGFPVLHRLLSQRLLSSITPTSTSSMASNTSDPAAAAALFDTVWGHFAVLLRAFCGTTAVLDVTLHVNGEVSMKPFLTDTSCSSLPWNSGAGKMPQDVEDALTFVGCPKSTVELLAKLMSCYRVVSTFQLEAGGLKSEAQENLDQLAVKLNINTRAFSSYFYPRAVTSVAQLEESRLGLLQALSAKMAHLAFKLPAKTVPVIVNVLALPQPRRGTAKEGGYFEDFLQGNLYSHVLLSLRRAVKSPINTAAAGAADDDPSAKERAVIDAQLGALEAAAQLLDTYATSGPELLATKMVEAVAKGGHVAGAHAKVASALGLGTSASPTSTASPQSASPAASSTGSPRPGRLNISAFSAAANEEPSSPTRGVGGGGVRGAAATAGPTQKAPIAKGTGKERELVSMLHPHLQHADWTSPVKYKLAKWTSLFRGQQVLPQSPPSLLSEYNHLVGRYFPPTGGASTTFAATGCVFGRTDWENGMVVIPLHLVRAAYYTQAVTLKPSELEIYECLVPRPDGSAARSSSASSVATEVMEILPINKFHWNVNASSNGGVDMTVHALTTLKNRFLKFKGHHLAVVQSAAAAIAAQRKIRKRRMWKMLTTVQSTARCRLSCFKLLGHQEQYAAQLTTELHFQQRSKIHLRENVNRDQLETDEQMSIAYIMKQSGSFLQPLFLRVRQDHQLLEMQHRFAIKEEEIRVKNSLISHWNSEYHFYEDEVRAAADAYRRSLRRVTEPFWVQCSMSRDAMEREEGHARRKLVDDFSTVLLYLREVVMRKRRKQQVSLSSEKVVVSKMGQSAIRRNSEESSVVHSLQRAHQPYDVSYQAYWGSSTSCSTSNTSSPQSSPHSRSANSLCRTDPTLTSAVPTTGTSMLYGVGSPPHSKTHQQQHAYRNPYVGMSSPPGATSSNVSTHKLPEERGFSSMMGATSRVTGGPCTIPSSSYRQPLPSSSTNYPSQQRLSQTSHLRTAQRTGNADHPAGRIRVFRNDDDGSTFSCGTI